MAERKMELVIRAGDEFSSALLKGLAAVEASFSRVRNGVNAVNLAFDETAAILQNMDGQVGRLGESADAYAEQSTSAISGQISLFQAVGEAFSFLTQNEENYSRAHEKFLTDSLTEVEKHQKQFTALTGIQETYEASVSSLSAVHTSAYRAMGAEMRKFVEVGKFTTKAFGEAVAQQVKMELIGLAARASVWAIFETAMGLKDLAMGLPTAALHFKSAGEFTAVAGASLAGAVGVQKAFFGGPHKESSGGSGTGAASIGGSPLPAGLEAGAPQATQNITVHIYNPLSEQNWQKIVEDNIIPAINGASDKNISVVVKTVY